MPNGRALLDGLAVELTGQGFLGGHSGEVVGLGRLPHFSEFSTYANFQI